MSRAVNDWQIAEWLDKEPRLRASIVVPTQNAEMAAEEIDRLGDHPGFVQVLLLVRPEMPLGQRHYWPIYEAAERHGLPIGIHAGVARQPHNPGRLALLLPGGLRQRGPGVPDPARQPGQRRRIRQFSQSAGCADRGRLHLVALAHVEVRQELEGLRGEVPWVDRRRRRSSTSTCA